MYVLASIEVASNFSGEELLDACMQSMQTINTPYCSRSFSMDATIDEGISYEPPILNPVHFTFKMGGFLSLGLLTPTPEPYIPLRYLRLDLKMKKENWDALSEQEKTSFYQFKDGLERLLTRGK